MKYLLPCLLFCICSFVEAQETLDDKPRARRFMIGVAASPEFAHRRVIINEPAYGPMMSYLDREHPRFGHTSGLYFNYFITDNFGIGYGIGYSVKGFHVPRSEVVPIARPGPPDRAIATHQTYTYGRHFIDVPLTAILQVGSGRWRSISQLGVALNLLYATSWISTLEYPDGRTHEVSSHYRITTDTVYLSGIISTGVGYGITERLELRMEPTLRYMFWNSRQDRDPYYSHYWNAGISVGAFLSL